MSGPGGPRNAAYRGVLFDLDGTLVDTLELILSSYRHTMAEHLGRVPPDEAWLQTMGTPLREQLRDFARSPDEAESMLQTYLEHNERHHEHLVRIFPGVRETIIGLRAAGYRLAVVTSKLRNQVIRELRSCQLTGLFHTLVCADDVDRPKPHPQPVQRAMEDLGLAPGDLLLVGDSVYDLQAGRAAGVHTAAALWGPFDRDRLDPARPDYWLVDIDELRALLRVEPAERDG